jgi:ParB/RepB/Spo0J family partition protein
MPISNSYKRVPLDQIIIERDTRQRREINTKGLVDSIRQLGVINPIIVTKDLVLVAGERRLAASREAALPDIPVRFVSDLTPIELQIIELEENVKRADLEWKDLVKSTGRIHDLYCAMDSGWTHAETAEKLSLTQGTITLYYRVYKELEDPKVDAAGTVREAYNLLTRRDQRKAGEEMQELLDVMNEVNPSSDTPELFISGAVPKVGAEAVPTAPTVPTPASTIVNKSFLDWVPTYTGKKFNVIHCDFPYGVDLFAGPQGRGSHDTYADTQDVYFTLLESFCTHLDKFMSISSHLMFWYSAKHHDKTMEIFRRLAPSLVFQPFPLIWIKSDNAGIASNVREGPRHIYETCLMASRGHRQIVKVVSDAYSAPTDKRFHVSTKPEPMLRHFMSMLVDDNSWVLDPTCGGASSIRAAEDLGAAHCLGMDIDPKCVEVAQMALKNSRSLRLASRSL